MAACSAWPPTSRTTAMSAFPYLRDCQQIDLSPLRNVLAHGNERYWRYKHDPSLPVHGCIKVTFKTKPADKATDATFVFKPFVPIPENRRQMQSDPREMQFVLQSPSIVTDPGVEPWDGTADADTQNPDGWNREKVMADVMKTAEIEQFTESQVTTPQTVVY
eukprot:6197310-Pleurochrysis_carterae.AAC.1